MKFKFLRRRLVFLLVIFLVLVAVRVFVRFCLLGGGTDALWEVTIGRTVYSERYKESSFHRVYLGMSSNQVKTLLGTPLRTKATGDPGEEIWYYTAPKVSDRSGLGADCCYTVRCLFLSNGVVTIIVHEFNFD